MSRHPRRITRRVVTALLAPGLLLLAPCSSADPPPIPWVGERGITQTVSQIMAREALRPRLDGLPLPVIESDERREPDRSALPHDPTAPLVAQWPPPPPPPSGPSDAGAGKGTLQPRSPQVVGVTFNAISYGDTAGFVPPDSSGDVGPDQILACSNGRIKVFSKTGAPGPLDAALDTFFDPVRNGTGTTDPRIRYDRHSHRWYVICITGIQVSNRCLIAVSSSPTITAASSFTFFFFQQDTVSPPGDPGGFLDYPTLGVDASALYIGGNMFGGPSLTHSVWVVRKSSLTSGGPIIATAARNLDIFTPQGVTNYDTTLADGFFVGKNPSGFSNILFLRVSTPAGTPTFGPVATLTVPATTSTRPVRALGTTGRLSAFDDRLSMASIVKDQLTGEVSLWTTHHFKVDATGVASATSQNNGARWYQFTDLSAAAPTLRQAGTMFDPTGGARNYWMSSLVMTGQGHMAIATSAANAAERARIFAAGRLASDPLGATRAATLIQDSTTAYNLGGTGELRWGDYSYTGLDPADDMTVWTFQEYCDATDSWGVRCIQLKAPPPALPASCSPSFLLQGAVSTDVVVTGISASGSGFFNSADPNITSHISASVVGPGVTVNTVTFTDPTHITLNLTISPDTPPGPRDVSVINPDGQTATSAALLTITTLCPADLNQDGVIDFGDYLEFLNFFDALDPRADLNQDGVIDFGDYLEFLNHFDAGC